MDRIETARPEVRHPVPRQTGIAYGDRRSPMTVYLDTSSLVKLYIAEADSAAVHQLAAAANVVVTSVVAYAEARAAFARRRRERLMTAGEIAAAVNQLDADWPHFLRITVDDELGLAAGRLAAAQGLRGYDAIHLASFERLLVYCADDDVRFSCADERLGRAARALG